MIFLKRAVTSLKWFAKMVILLALVGCTNDYDPQAELDDELLLEEAGGDEIELYYGIIEEMAVFVVEEIFEDDGNVVARLIPGEPRFTFLESPRFIGLKEEVEIRRIWASDFDNSTLWLKRRGTVEVEEENILNDATKLDIVEGDVLRLYVREVGYPFDEWGGSATVNRLERIVVVR